MHFKETHDNVNGMNFNLWKRNIAKFSYKVGFTKSFLIIEKSFLIITNFEKEVVETREKYSLLYFHRYFDILGICFQDICSGIYKVYQDILTLQTSFY